jgi:hypothetical protein
MKSGRVRLSVFPILFVLACGVASAIWREARCTVASCLMGATDHKATSGPATIRLGTSVLSLRDVQLCRTMLISELFIRIPLKS